MDKNGINKQNESNNKAYIHDNPSFVNDDIEIDKIQVTVNDQTKTKKKKSTDPNDRELKLLELFRYSDGLDKLLLIVGTISAIVSAGIYPLMFFVYEKVSGTLVDLEKFRILNKTDPSVRPEYINNSNSFCYQLSDSNPNFDGRIEDSINYYVIFGFTSIFLCYVSSVCWNTAAERQIKRIRNLLFRSLIHQEMAFFDKSSPGELNSRLTSNIETLKLGFGFKFADFIAIFGRGIGCFIYAMSTTWKFSIVFLAIMPFISACTTILIVLVKKYTILELKSYGDAGKVAQEVLSSLRTVLSFGSIQKEIKRYEKNLINAENLATKKGLSLGVFSGLTFMLFNFVFAIGIYYATYLTRTDCENYTPGGVMKSLMLMITATFALGQAMPYLKDLAEARGAAKSIFSIIEKKSEINTLEKKDKKVMDKFVGEIKLENVFFNYPQRPEAKILTGLSLNIPSGKTIALCGSSGCGKSTVIQLLQRFYEPLSGSIEYDGVNIKDLDLEWLRSNISLVSQEPILFSTSIKENIRLGRLDATEAEIEEAARAANAHDFIQQCPDKYNTQVGERGSQMSGGQKQRIAIARAILKKPRILLLDEATSALDNESEKIVQEALDRVKHGRTTIVVAHRLSTIRNADLIVGLEGGQVKEVGTHEELMKLKGVYYELVMLQTKQEEEERGGEQIGEEQMSKKLKEARENKEIKLKEMRNDEEDEESSDEQDEKEEIGSKKKKKRRTTTLKLSLQMWKYNKPELLFILVGVVAQIVNAAVSPTISLIFSNIWSIFSIPDEEEQERESLKYMGIIFGLAFLNLASSILLNYSFSLIGARLIKRIRVKMFESYLRQEVAYHDLDENKSAILSTRLASSVPFCKGITSDFLSLFCQAISGVGFSVVVGLVLNWKLCLVILCFIPINILAGMMNIQSVTNKQGKKKTSEEESGRLAIEVVENIKTVISLGREGYFITQFEALFSKNFNKLLGYLHVQAVFYGISNSVLFFIQAAAFSYGYYLIKYEDLALTNLFRIYASITFTSMTLGRIFAQMPDVKKSREAVKMALSTINRVSKIDSMSQSGQRPADLIGDIRFNNVRFSYPNRPNVKVLDNFSLDVKKGQVNALVGSSGCGKSTSIALLLRFYDVDGGSITIDNIDIRELNIQWLRSKMGLVSQEPILFNYGIKENIEYGRIYDENIKLEEIISVAKSANINNRIENLPDGYNTIVGTKGGQLSGGEKQRVAIARALLREPKILLLDEATSALDSQSEKVVQEALENAQKGRTCIVIAHRLCTIKNSDKISSVQDGKVVEEGTHESLMRNRGLYYSLNNSNKSEKS